MRGELLRNQLESHSVCGADQSMAEYHHSFAFQMQRNMTEYHGISFQTPP